MMKKHMGIVREKYVKLERRDNSVTEVTLGALVAFKNRIFCM